MHMIATKVYNRIALCHLCSDYEYDNIHQLLCRVLQIQYIYIYIYIYIIFPRKSEMVHKLPVKYGMDSFQPQMTNSSLSHEKKIIVYILGYLVFVKCINMFKFQQRDYHNDRNEDKLNGEYFGPPK